MTWAKLLANNNVTRSRSSKLELDRLRSIVARSLTDVAATGLSADSRFIMAYDAARTLSLMIVRASGYRPRTVGGHYNTFLALEAADSAFAALSAYFDGCRIKRNASEYDFARGCQRYRGRCALNFGQAVRDRCGVMDQGPSSGVCVRTAVEAT